MLLDLKNLPGDTKLLHQIITDLSDENSSLKNQLALLKAKRFGKSSEKLTLDKLEQEKLDKQIADLELQAEEEEEETAREVINDLKEEDSKKEKNKPKRQPLPPHLPRIDKTLNPDLELRRRERTGGGVRVGCSGRARAGAGRSRQ